ncbi:hypothetical protein PL321_05290 [Caloramator sp. mosi_1]|uniref:hypothetical protein n=1 Tax=Caloramator sp. mosi_1 TaxID=3023090 RepID=UPI002361B52A|nr:hypothetical protein [Caloramator sp. mosi_1]WDC84965.1 hypothetical protein PL321_05290 [Caloramator sp. mosi_1]
MSDGSYSRVKIKNWLNSSQSSSDSLEYLGELDLSPINNVEPTTIRAKVNVIKKVLKILICITSK